MVDILPAALWCVDVVLSLNIIVICLRRGGLLKRYAGGVARVSWPVTIAHVASALLGLTPYLAFTWFADGGFDPDVRDFYVRYGWPSATVVVLLILVQLVCLYLQAKRAMMSEMDARLNRAKRK
ncbi:hypothetical protein [Bifidobacterium parmae]|uniref:Anaerobic C4-dicarboxylate transport protein n=1 Tax=Bifidobacterium parmae TaxID=361854 RepID=A0A2N5IWQ0_9BIFI|nr:hypothetical protein [Bifidobacterium parmae]PLS26385.1 hypothetical protein Uis4E_1960 [Bifidobacterium parmae]